jgi:N-acetylglucosamine-6-phosphate deacetylase
MEGGTDERSVVIRGGAVVTPGGVRRPCDVRIEADRIAAIGPALPGDEVIDAQGHLIAPGFLDLQIHGAGGAMFEDGDVEGNERILAVLARSGTTGLLATVATLPPDRLISAVEAIAACAGRRTGARVVGIHMEGPHLNPRWGGAQNPSWMRPPSIEEFDDLQRRSGGLIRLVTVAPETPGCLSFITALRERSVRVAIGHSAATEEEMESAVAAGATHVTHLFNAMPPLHHRRAGVLGTALTDDRLSVELICDGHHVGRRAIEIALRCKGADRVVLVSDGVGALGLREGEIDLFGSRCAIRAGAVRREADGVLAGSCLTLARAVQNLREWLPSWPLHDLLPLASRAPARAAGLLADGIIEPGRRADLVVLDRSLEVVATVCGGQTVFRAI